MRDAGLAGLHQAVNAYARRVQAAGPNAVGLFYYSGHGAADAGTNYLIPIDVKTTETGELWDQSLRLTEITRKLKTEAGNATHFVVFDACRNTLKLTNAGSRALVQSKGFVPVAQESGMLIAYATAEGELASDVGAGAGPYAKALAEEIIKPGVEAVAMFRVVQRRVRMAIRQEPYLGFNAMGDVYLAGAEMPKPPSPGPEVAEVAREWARVDKTNVAELETFVRRHGSSAEADYARARIEELKKGLIPPVPKREQPTTTTGMPRCKYYLERALCELNVMCSWAANAKCQQKVGGLATAMLEALPASKPTPEGPCAGVETLVGNEKRCLKPGDNFKDCPDCPEMVVVLADSFMMGSPAGEKRSFEDEGPQHKVTIARPFAVGKYEVTFTEWDACVAAGSCKRKPGDEGWGRGWRPVINVSWNDITQEYLPWLSSETGKTYRLLTEAEWEYAARAGTTTPFSTGWTITPDQANFHGSLTYGGSAKGVNWGKTVEVGSFAPNAFGLYDMHGNVWEWLQDCWNKNYNGAPADGSAWITGDCGNRVVRGGAWSKDQTGLRSAIRRVIQVRGHSSGGGFRLARTLTP